MQNKSVLIVGAGISGLAAALRLASKGFQVTIVEKSSTAGGRLNKISFDGFSFDTGPSFFSMSYEFEQFAKDCNIKLPFEYYPLDPLYVVNFSNNPKYYHLYKNEQKLAEQFKDIEPDFEQKFKKYLIKSGDMFHDTIDIVIKSNFDSYLQYFRNLMKVNPSHLPVLLRSFYNQVSRYFDSDVVKQIISLVAFFLGRTPFDTMGIYTLLSYTEFKHDGYHNVVGGMYKIVEGLLEELKKHNVNIHYNTEIVDFQANGSKLFTFIDNEGNHWSADIFLINSDAAYFRGIVLKRDEFSQSKLDKMQWTMGYLTIYLGLNIKLNNVAHHNYFLGENYTDYAKKVYRNPDTLEKPYYYVNVISKHNSELAPDGCESVFIVCPVPDLRYKSNWDDAEVIVNSIVQDFSKRIGININEHIVAKRFFTPIDWQNKFNLYRGSGLGLAHNMWQIGAFRPKNFDEVFENVFYAGASTHPGAGLPMGIISSKLAFERIMQYCHK